MIEDDYALDAVPADKRVSGIRIATVVIGIIIALPAFMTGAEIGFAQGFRDGALSILIGGAILSAIAMATGTVGAKTGLNTAMITRLTFGAVGGRIVSLILALTCLGWFGVTAELFGRGVQQILAGYGRDVLPLMTYIILGGILMVFTTIYGFSALQRLSNFTVPLLAILIGYTAYVTLCGASVGALAEMGGSGGELDEGVSAIVGGLSVAVTIFPDFCRFSRSASSACFSSILIFGIAMPVVLLLAMIPSIVTHQRDLMIIMTTLGLGIPALLLLIVKAWATNAGNLYSASLSAANVVSNRHQKFIVVTAGVIGIAFAVAGISESLIPFLLALGISIPPIAGIYAVHFFGVRDADAIDTQQLVNYRAFSCWLLGIIVAVAVRGSSFTFTGIAACDSMMVAGSSYLLAQRFRGLLQRHA